MGRELKLGLPFLNWGVDCLIAFTGIEWQSTVKLNNFVLPAALQKQQAVLFVMDNLLRVENLNLTYRLHIQRMKYGSADRVQSSTFYSINISTTEIGTYILEIFLDGIQVTFHV